MRRALSFREGLTVVVGWDKGFVSEPGAAAKVALFLRSNWPFSISAGVFVVMFWLWYTRGRDPRLRPIVPQYAPPDGLTPGEAGTLVDNSADMRDITATIVDLAVRGYILIEEKEKRSEEHTSELQSRLHLVCRLLLEKKKKTNKPHSSH